MTVLLTGVHVDLQPSRRFQQMNPARLHIILNHIPVISIPFGAALLIYGFLRKSQEIRTAGLLVFVAIALVTVLTFFAGKAAKDMVEHLPGVSEQLIENYENAAWRPPITI